MTPPEAFLQRVRQAVIEGNRPGETAPIEPRGHIGYQGAGSDSIVRFRDELAAAGGQLVTAVDPAAAAESVLGLVRERRPQRVLLGQGAVLDRLELRDGLTALGTEVVSVADLTAERSRDAFFQADIGISGVDHLIAETGTIALLCRPDEPRSLSLLPPVHIAVADRTQILADLFDLFDLPDWKQSIPSCLSLITGPSKTGDIELRLVTGVHGPGEVHVVLITS
jgi:L-lactate dehydrogenase complex protein LldG